MMTRTHDSLRSIGMDVRLGVAASCLGAFFLNTNGVPFVLRFVTLGGKASETPGANLALTLVGDPLHFSNTTSPIGGTIDVRGIHNVQTLSYILNNPILIGTASTSVPLLIQGGGSSALTLGNTWTAGGQIGTLFIDRSAPGAVVRSSPTLTEGIVAVGAYGNATVIVKDATGTGFATTNALGEIVRYTGAATLLPSSSSFSTNYKTTGTLTLNAGTHNAYTLELDASGGPGLLDLGGSRINGKILMIGANDVTLQNGTNSFGGWVHQFGSGTLTVGTIVNEDFRKSGPGRLVLTGTNTLTVGGSVTGLTIEDGVVQAVEGVGMPTNAVLRVYGGVFQSNGNITRTVHSDSPYVASKVAWRGFNSNGHVGRGGGFAAQGGTLTVNLDAGATLTWGSGAFVQTSQALVLGSTSADSLLDWQNNLDLGALPNSSPPGSKLLRAVQVDDNPASSSDIAQFSGVLSGVAGGLLKTGDGTLRLTRANTYGGPTDVTAGTLLVNGSLSAANAPVTVTAGGTLGGTGTVNRTVTAYAGGTLRPGSGGMGTLNVASNVTVHGTIVIDGTAGLTCATNCVVGSGASLAWGTGATGRVTVNGTLNLPSAASVTFAATPSGSVVLFESPNAIVGSPAVWTATPTTVTLRLSDNGKQVLASVAGGTLVLVR